MCKARRSPRPHSAVSRYGSFFRRGNRQSRLRSDLFPDLTLKGIRYHAISGTLNIQKGEVSLQDSVLYGRDVRGIANGEILLPKRRLNLLRGVQVFRTVDDLLEEVPLAGPILLGKDRMFIAASSVSLLISPVSYRNMPNQVLRSNKRMILSIPITHRSSRLFLFRCIFSSFSGKALNAKGRQADHLKRR